MKRYKITIEISPDENVTMKMIEEVFRRTFINHPKAVYPANATFKIEEVADSHATRENHRS